MKIRTIITRAGESWSEPAKLLAVFVIDTDDKVLTTPVKKP